MHGSVYACTWWLRQEPLCSLDIPLPLVSHSVVLSLLINACLTCQVSASLHHNVVIFTDVQMDVCQNDQLPSSAFVVNMCKQTLSIDCVLFRQRMEAFLLLRLPLIVLSVLINTSIFITLISPYTVSSWKLGYSFLFFLDNVFYFGKLDISQNILYSYWLRKQLMIKLSCPVKFSNHGCIYTPFVFWFH